MSIQLIQQRLASYHCQSEQEEQHALREITQEIILAALGRGDFFKHALFQGGTCLRILYGLNRFSEDMDYILREPDSKFKLTDHLERVVTELEAYGYQLTITDRSKSSSIVQKAFLKDDSLGKVLTLNHIDRSGPMKKINIKLEVDTNPPSGSVAELKYLDFPFVSSVSVQDKPSLFAGKIHALLCRQYIKGRDWYDFIWYISNQVKINLVFLESAINQMGPWKNEGLQLDHQWVVEELKNRILSVDWKKTAADVRPFVRVNEQPSIDLWGKELFLYQLDKMEHYQ